MLQASRGSLLRSCAFTQSSFFYLNMLFTCGCENHTKIKLVNIVKTILMLYTYTLSMDKRFSTKWQVSQKQTCICTCKTVRQQTYETLKWWWLLNMYSNSTSDTGRNIIILTSYNYCKKIHFSVSDSVIYIETYKQEKNILLPRQEL